MPRIKLSPELKAAILDLPDKEKDKLLLRLIPSNARLVDRLIFDLLENGETQEDRREDLGREIELGLQRISEEPFSPGMLLMQLRSFSGEITRHVHATRDKYGEVALHLLLLVETFENFGDRIGTVSTRKGRVLSDFIIKRALRILKMLGKLHVDLHLDFLDDLRQLGQYIGEIETLRGNAAYHGLDFNALLR